MISYFCQDYCAYRLWILGIFSRGAVVTTPLCKRSCLFKYSCSNFLNVHMDRRKKRRWSLKSCTHTHTWGRRRGVGLGGGHRILNNTAAASWILHLQRGEGCWAEDIAWQTGNFSASFFFRHFPSVLKYLPYFFIRECRRTSSVCSGLYPWFSCKSGKRQRETE